MAERVYRKKSVGAQSPTAFGGAPFTQGGLGASTTAPPTVSMQGAEQSGQRVYRKKATAVTPQATQRDDETGYRDALAATKKREELLGVDTEKLASDIQFTEGLIDLINEYRDWESKDPKYHYNEAGLGAAEVGGNLYGLEQRMAYYGISPEDKKSLEEKLAAAKEQYGNAKDAQVLDAVGKAQSDPDYVHHVNTGAAMKKSTFDNYDKIAGEMTQEQKQNYNYLLSKYGKEDADRYFKMVQSEIQSNRATDFYKKHLEDTWYEGLFSVVQGLDQASTGLQSAFGNKHTDDRLFDPQMVGAMVRENLGENSTPLWYNFKEGKWEDKAFGSTLGQIAYDFGSTTANMVPAIGLGAASNLVIPGAGAYVTPALLGISSGGNAYKEALSQGYTEQQARTYGALVGSSEALLGKVLGSIGPAGKSLTGSAIQGATSGIKNAGARFALQLGGEMLSEAAEEGLQEILTPFFENIALDADNTWEDIDWEQATYSALMGALSAGLFEGAVTPLSSVAKQSAQQNAQYRTLGRQFINGENGVNIDAAIAIGLDNAKGTDAYKAAQKIQQQVKAGKTVSPYTVGRMVAQSQTEQAQTARNIERTVLSTAKEWNIPTDAAETVSAAAVSLGQKVEFVSPEGMHNRYMAGEYDSATDTVRLNAAERNVEKLIGAVLAHEMVHTAEGTDQLQKLAQIAERMENHKNGAGAWEKLQADVKSKYAAADKQLSDPEVKKEALAHWIAENLFQNKAFAKAVADGDANVGNAFFYMIDRVRRAMGAKKASAGNLAMLERLFMQALDNRTLGPREGDVQGAIGYTEDNQPVVIITEDILAGVSANQYVDVAEEIIKTRFSNGIPISGRLIKVNKFTRDEYTHSKNTQHYESNDGVVYADKMRAAGQLDEIVLASTNYINEDLNHKRKDKFVQFARGDVLMRIGNRDYSAKVIVGFTSGNNMVLYDVIDFVREKTPFTIKKETGARSPSTQMNAEDSSNTPDSNTNVAQNPTDVNTKSMQEGAGISTQGALLPPEYRPGARVEGVNPTVESGEETPSVADGDTSLKEGGLRGVDGAAPYGADLSIDEAAVLETAIRSQPQGKRVVYVSMDTDSYDEDDIVDIAPYLDELSDILGEGELLKRMYNAAQVERPTGTVEIAGQRVDVTAYIDAYERSLPDNVEVLDQVISRLRQKRTKEIERLYREGTLEKNYTFGGLKIDLQLFAAQRKRELLQLSPGENGKKVRQFYEKRLRGTDANHSQELVDLLAGRSETYNPIANQRTLNNAKSNLTQPKYQADLRRRLYNDNRRDLFTADEVAAASVMINNAINDMDYAEAANLVAGLSRKGTIAGRAVQAFSMMARLTPEGTLKAATRALQKDIDNIVGEDASKGLDTLVKELRKTIKSLEQTLARESGRMHPAHTESTETQMLGVAPQKANATKSDREIGGAELPRPAYASVEGNADRPVGEQQKIPSREELVQMLSEDLAAEEGNYLTQKQILEALQKVVDDSTNIPEQLKRYVLKKIRKGDGSLAQRIYEVYRKGDLSKVELRRAMEEALELPHLTAEDVGWIVKKTTEIQSLENEPVKQADAMDELYDYVGAKLLVRAGEKWAAWRKFAMLANPKTHIRNFVSNLAYMAVRNVDSAVATGLEWALVKIGAMKPEERAAAFGWRCTGHGQKIIDTIEARVPEAVMEMQGRGKKYEDGGNPLKRHRKMHGTGKLGTLIEKGADANSKLLETADIAFFRPAYINALGQIMTARKTTEVTNEMHNTAMKRALEATFRNKNWLSEKLSVPKRGTNSNKWGTRSMAQAYDVVIPYVNTPAAVAEQTVLHSPVGIAVGSIDLLLKCAGKSSKSSADIVNTFAKNITGSTLFAIGLLLARAGWLRIAYRSGDKDKAADEMEGLQENSIVIGDISISIDWLQPVAAPLIMGGAFAEANAARDDDTIDSMLGVGYAAAESLFSLSMLQSFYDVVGGYSGGFGGGVAGSFGTVAENVISQSIPTLLGQAARALDPVQRKVQDGTLKGSLLNPILAKIPFASRTLDPELDVWGNEVYRTGRADTTGKVLNAVQQFVSPSNIKRGTATDDPISAELLRLYHAYDDGAALPTEIDRKKAPKGEDWIDLNRLLGGVNRLIVEEFINNKKAYDVYVETGEKTDRGNPRKKKVTKYYRDMTDEERINVLENQIYANTKEEVTGKTAHIPEEHLNDTERYVRDLLRRVRNGGGGAAATAAAEPKTDNNTYYSDLLRRMKNGN